MIGFGCIFANYNGAKSIYSSNNKDIYIQLNSKVNDLIGLPIPSEMDFIRFCIKDKESKNIIISKKEYTVTFNDGLLIISNEIESFKAEMRLTSLERVLIRKNIDPDTYKYEIITSKVYVPIRSGQWSFIYNDELLEKKYRFTGDLFLEDSPLCH